MAFIFIFAILVMFSMVNANKDGYETCKRYTTRLDTLLINVNWDAPKPDDIYIKFHTQWDFANNYTTETTMLSFIISTFDYENPWTTDSIFNDFTPGQNKISRWDKVGIIHGLTFLNYSITVLLSDDHYVFGCIYYDRRDSWWLL
ncbi:hypothetical protein C2G38_2099128 [Gigaspora rosea]|uniref:Uncharacterized protein n=1 Tax=Gigaspora rosea TaxID=44941 RepID=A0A397UVB6_9GLOM|nr:hypothetical protein C2G38_2099128 [Gigaspora rosea]CAG8661860.1 8522_t:CDS:1 [Gigaspora rosea]